MPLITIDPGKCIGDGLCVELCGKVFSREDEGSAPIIAHEDSCNSCGHCVLACPAGAITQADSPPERVHPVREALLPTFDQVREMIVSRRSVRLFQRRPVNRELIRQVIDCARQAQSAKNSQSTEYTVITGPTRISQIAAVTGDWLGGASRRLKNPLWRRLYRLKGERDAEEITRWIGQFERISEQTHSGKDVILFGAPVLLLFHALRSARFGETNAALALQNAVYAASSLGLGSFFAGYVVSAAARDKRLPPLLGLRKGERLYGGLAMGYPRFTFSSWIERKPPGIRWFGAEIDGEAD